MSRIYMSAFVLAAFALAWGALPVGSQEKKGDIMSEMDAAAMKAAMESWTKACTPGAEHKRLEGFVGSWDTTLRVWMMGQGAPPTEFPGVTEFKWIYPGRWLETSARFDGSFLDPTKKETLTRGLMGYDNYKRKNVMIWIDDSTTNLRTAEGNWTPDGKALIGYGTMDEPMTGELDKMVKYVYRFRTQDNILLEVHDLPIGEVNTKVVEIEYKRKAK